MGVYDDLRRFPAGDDPSLEVDDLRADISQLEDEIQGLEHDLALVAEIHRTLGLSVWGMSVEVTEPSAEVTEDQAAVLDRLALL